MARVELAPTDKRLPAGMAADAALGKMIARFRRRVRNERILQTFEDKRQYVKPSDRKRKWMRPK
jgi:ribosomal protein S21